MRIKFSDSPMGLVMFMALYVTGAMAIAATLILLAVFKLWWLLCAVPIAILSYGFFSGDIRVTNED